MLVTINVLVFIVGAGLMGLCSYALVRMCAFLASAEAHPLFAGTILWIGILIGLVIALVAVAGCFGSTGTSDVHHCCLFVYCVAVSLFVFAQAVFVVFFFLSGIRLGGASAAGGGETALQRDLDRIGQGLETVLNTTYETCFNATTGLLRNTEDDVCEAVTATLNITRVGSAAELERRAVAWFRNWIVPICASSISVGAVELLCIFMACHVLSYEGARACGRRAKERVLRRFATASGGALGGGGGGGRGENGGGGSGTSSDGNSPQRGGGSGGGGGGGGGARDVEDGAGGGSGGETEEEAGGSAADGGASRGGRGVPAAGDNDDDDDDEADGSSTGKKSQKTKAGGYVAIASSAAGRPE